MIILAIFLFIFKIFGNKDGISMESLRLPTSVKPLIYYINFTEINLENFYYNAEENVDLEVLEETQQIVFHTTRLYLSEIFLKQNEESLKPETISFNIPDETCTIVFGNKLSIGKYSLFIRFSGTFDERLNGFYRSKYDFNGKTYYMATTQFEHSFARSAFPCWDEPALKAIFIISMTLESQYTPLTNMNVIEKQSLDDKHLYYLFEKTPIMSTYLLAFIIGRFDHITAYSRSKVEVNLYTIPGSSKHCKFALDVAVRALDYYENFFDIPFPLPKCDHIAIPDFDAGAMENWGLITYREIALLIDENSSIARKRRVATTVSHEIAHQWFGNLVTMEWWTHLWLNEGFATYMAAQCLDNIFPDWKVFDDFVVDAVKQALTLDSLETTHPIEVEVGRPEEVNSIFDTISYYKGASIIRMLINFIGMDCFQKGIHLYLSKYAYKNALTDNLWECLGSSSTDNIKEFMNIYTSKGGYPMINVKYVNNKIICTHDRYRVTNSTQSTYEKWIIPLHATVIHKDDSVEYIKLPLLRDDNGDLSSEFHTAINNIDGIVKLNTNFSTFCRINYDLNYLSLLIPYIENKVLPPMDRLNILSDGFASYQAGYIDSKSILKLCSAYNDEDDYGVLEELSNNIAELSNLYSDESFYPKFQSFVHNLFEKYFIRFGWEPKSNDDDRLKSLRNSIIRLYVIHGNDTKEKEEAIKRYNLYIKDKEGNNIDPNLRDIYYQIAISQDDEEQSEKVFEQLIELRHHSTLNDEKMRLLVGMGKSKYPRIIYKSIDYIFGEHVRQQDSYWGIISIGMNKYGKEISWKYIQDNYDSLHKKYHSYLSMLQQMVCSSFSSFKTRSIIDEVNEYFSKKDTSSIKRGLAQSLETIRLRIERLERESPMMVEYFSTCSN